MKITITFFLVNLLLIFTSVPALAQSSDHPDSLALRELLVNKNFEKLNSEIMAYQKRYEENIVNEINFDKVFRAFDVPEPGYEKLFIEWIEQYPASYWPYLAYGYYQMGMGWHASKTTMKITINKHQYFQMALDNINKSISINPNIILSYARIISIMDNIGSKKSTNDALKEGLKINPASYTIHTYYLHSLHPHYGGTYSEIEDHLKIIKQYENQNKNLIPLAGFLDYIKGHMVAHKDKHKERIKFINNALKHGDKHWYYYERGLSYYFLENYDQSISDHTRALELYHEYIDALLWRSWAYRKKKMYAEALGDLDLAAELDPYNFRAINNCAYVLTIFNQYDEAVEDYKRATLLNSNDAQTWANLAWNSGFKLNDYQTAVDAYKKSNELDPNNANYIYNYALVLNNMRDCKMGPVLKKYLKLCRGSKSKDCADNKIKWADDMINFVNTNEACANSEKVVVDNSLVSTSNPDKPPETTWDKIKHFLDDLY